MKFHNTPRAWAIRVVIAVVIFVVIVIATSH